MKKQLEKQLTGYLVYPKFTSEKILEPHIQMTRERMKGHDVVLSLHDSSYFSFNTKPSIMGLGNIGGSLGDGEETKDLLGIMALVSQRKANL